MPRVTALRDGKAVIHSPPRALVVALVRDITKQSRITTALRELYDIHFVDEASALLELTRTRTQSIQGVIVEMRDRRNRPTHEVIRKLIEAGLSAPIVAYCRAGAEFSAEIRALVLAGAHELLFEGLDESGVELRAVLCAAQQTRLGERAAGALQPLVNRKLWPFIQCVTAFPTTQRVSAVAGSLGYSRRTLVNRCREAGVPPPQELLAWCRLAVVGELLSSTSQTVESIALQLDFPSDTALRNMIKRHISLRATEVRERGGLACVVCAFTSALDARGAQRRSAT